MNLPPDLESIRRLLESDRGWSVYALADLEPDESPYCAWRSAGRTVVLVYHGLQPPVLFVHGDDVEALGLLADLPAGSYVFSLRPPLRRRLAPRLHVIQETGMWRMVLAEAELPPDAEAGCIRLGLPDLAELEGLFGGHADRPDAFQPRQLERGVFFGIRLDARLVAAAGTHVVAPGARLAAVGNVFTHPDFRGRGLARRTTAAVVARLLEDGARTIALNVSRSNQPAIRCYHRLGFRQHCDYQEGLAELKPAASSQGEVP